MRVAQAFSTSIRHAKQALYEPYIPPLNEEQKKALRKLMLTDAPRYHSRFQRDVNWLLNINKVRDVTLQRRRNTLERINAIVKSAFGSEYSVMDRSLSQYSRDLDWAPFELAITDGRWPTGIPPAHIVPQLPGPYDHEALARLLQKHGYTGYFIAGDPARNEPRSTEKSGPPRPGRPERGPYPVTHPWPTYSPQPTRYLTYPPVLFAESVSNDRETMPFFLSPVVPTITPLLHLLKIYTSMGVHYGDFITFVFLWLRSNDLLEFTPTCVALMVIACLQNSKSLPSIQIPKENKSIQTLARENDGVWFVSTRHSKDHIEPMISATWLETGFLEIPWKKPSKKTAPMLDHFFRFWGLPGRDSVWDVYSQFVSIREGTVMNRHYKMRKDEAVVRLDDNAISHGVVPSLNDQPIMWQAQPIVVQDPFVPSYNHAHPVSRKANGCFRYLCSLSRRTIIHSHPMAAILGNIELPHRRMYSTIPISQQILDMFQASLPPEPIIESRRKTISRVQNVIRKKFGNTYAVECFGSTRYGVSTSTSDLDLVVIDKSHMNGFPHHVPKKRLPAIYDVSAIARALRSNRFKNVIPIPKAKVPIVKFRDRETKLDCDLNVNEQLGIYNTQLIAQYCELAPGLLRPLIVVVKRWAKSHGLNDASGKSGPASFSSYALVLMLIGYLQIRRALPSLQAGLDPLPDGGKEGVFWLPSDGKQSVRCDVRFVPGLDWKPQARVTPKEALFGWLMFWGSEFRYKEDILSIREGQLVQRCLKTTSGKKMPHPQENMTLLELQQQRMKTEEDAALAAFAEQSQDGDDALEIEEYFLPAVEPETARCAVDQDRQMETVELQSVKDHKAVQAIQGATDEITAEINEPSTWRNNKLVVADPFILSKNVCANIGKDVLNRFRAECLRAMQMLDCGAGLGDVMGEVVRFSRTKSDRERNRSRDKEAGGKLSGHIEEHGERTPMA